MVRKIFNFISKEIGGLHEAAYLLGLFAFLSQILALIRDRLFAHAFGASQTLDTYYAAFRLPDLIFVSIASIVSLSVLIPFLMERLDRGEKEAKEFIDSIFSAFFFIIGITAVIAYIAAPYILRVLFPTFSANFPELVLMTRIMLLSPIFLGFSNFLASITQIYKRYFIYALSPIVYNLGIIIGVLVFYPLVGMSGLAWGVALGAILHFLIQVPFVATKSLFPRLRLAFSFNSVRQVIMTSLPRTLTLSSTELSKFFLIAFAALLAGGAISIFNFAWNLQSVPLSIIGVSYSLAAFPVLTRLFSSGETSKFVEQMTVSSKHILFWSVPIMTLFIVLRAQIVRVILGTGEFSWSDTRLTAAALALFTISLIPQSFVMLFVRAYYSRGETKKPLIMNLVSSILIIIFSYGLVILFKSSEYLRFFIESLLRVEDVPGTIMLMLPLGFSLGVFINGIIHWIAFERDFRGYSLPVLRSLYHFFSASVMMGYVTYMMLSVGERFFDIDTFIGIFMQGFIAGIVGIFVFVGVLILMRNQELVDITATLKKKIWKTTVIPPDPSST